MVWRWRSETVPVGRDAGHPGDCRVGRVRAVPVRGRAVIARLVVHFDVALTSPNARSHWSTRSKNNRKAKRAAHEAWLVGGMPISTNPVDVQIVLLRSRELDQDNALAACKSIIDGLFKDRITADDAPAWVYFLPVEQRPHKSHRLDPTVIVEVHERKRAE